MHTLAQAIWRSIWKRIDIIEMILSDWRDTGAGTVYNPKKLPARYVLEHSDVKKLTKLTTKNHVIVITKRWLNLQKPHYQKAGSIFETLDGNVDEVDEVFRDTN